MADYGIAVNSSIRDDSNPFRFKCVKTKYLRILSVIAQTKERKLNFRMNLYFRRISHDCVSADGVTSYESVDRGVGREVRGLTLRGVCQWFGRTPSSL